MRNAVFLEEHMLSAAKANAFSSESTSLDRIAWDISIGTHAQLTKRFSPTHELQQFGIVGLRRQSTELALDYAAGGAIEGKPVALFEHLPLNVHLALLFVYVNIAAPATQHLPMPRVTTAAWLGMPPRDVRIPIATSIP